jgi:hypothetical protein
MEEDKSQIITLNDKEYKYSDLSERGKIIINQLNVINYNISECKLQLDRHEAARQMFIIHFKNLIEGDEGDGATSLSLVSPNK